MVKFIFVKLLFHSTTQERYVTYGVPYNYKVVKLAGVGAQPAKIETQPIKMKTKFARNKSFLINLVVLVHICWTRYQVIFPAIYNPTATSKYHSEPVISDC